MKINSKISACISYFSTIMPHPQTELSYSKPFELVVAVILSAQCTDKRVNQISPTLFKTFPTIQDFADASIENIYQLIKSCSYPNNKAKHIHACANTIIRQFNGTIPQTVEELETLPGVGRKTANVVAAVLFNQPTMAVDTHVFRVTQRIGIVPPSKTTLEVEKHLVKSIPTHAMHNMHHWLILHGRYTCKARKPKCTDCGIQKICDYYTNKNSKLALIPPSK